ncbi:MAG: LytR/AlgR family response regulator transcription factor, partial [Ruminococcus sp.]
MNIAICDDETVFIRQLHRKISEMKIPDCHIHEFTSGRDLLNNTVAGKFEIIILDVEMPEMNGLSVAEIIRRTDKNVIISFLTNYAEFAVQGYAVDAFRYILKTQPDYILKQQLESIFEECRQRFKTYSFSNRNMSFTFNLDDIICFEVHGRIVTLSTKKGAIEYYGDFSAICEEL